MMSHQRSLKLNIYCKKKKKTVAISTNFKTDLNVRNLISGQTVSDNQEMIRICQNVILRVITTMLIGTLEAMMFAKTYILKMLSRRPAEENGFTVISKR